MAGSVPGGTPYQDSISGPLRKLQQAAMQWQWRTCRAESQHRGGSGGAADTGDGDRVVYLPVMVKTNNADEGPKGRVGIGHCGERGGLCRASQVISWVQRAMFRAVDVDGAGGPASRLIDAIQVDRSVACSTEAGGRLCTVCCVLCVSESAEWEVSRRSMVMPCRSANSRVPHHAHIY